MLDRFRPGIPLTLLTIAGFAVLLALGTWQLQRLQWKTALIAEISEGLQADATPIGAEDLAPFRPVVAQGRLRSEPVLFQGSYARASQPGVMLTSVFETEDGRQWLVERGWIPESATEDARAGFFGVDGKLAIEAITRPLKRVGPFTPASDFASNRIYAEDRDELNSALGLDLEPLVLVLTSDLPAGPPWDGLPRLSPPEPDLPNNHLGYVVTWYGLAAALLGVYIAFGLARAKEQVN